MVKNAVHEVANRAGIDLSNNHAFKQNAASVTGNMANSVGNLQNIKDIAQEYADQQGPQAAGPQAGSGIGAVAKAAVGVAAGIAAPVLGPVAGAVVLGGMVVAAAGEALNFSTSHAALDGGVGEMTLASNAAQFDDKGEMTSYTSACDGVTTAVASGKAIGRTVIGSNAAAPAQGMHNFGAIVGEVAEEFDPQQFQADILKLAQDNTDSINHDKQRLLRMNAIASNDPTMNQVDDFVAEVNQDIKLAVKAPVMPNMGMPSFRLG